MTGTPGTNGVSGDAFLVAALAARYMAHVPNLVSIPNTRTVMAASSWF